VTNSIEALAGLDEFCECAMPVTLMTEAACRESQKSVDS